MILEWIRDFFKSPGASLDTSKEVVDEPEEKREAVFIPRVVQDPIKDLVNEKP